MRVKMLRSLGRNLPDLIPAGDKDAKDAVASLMGRPQLPVETEVVDVADKEADLLKKYGLAEDAARDAPLGVPQPQPQPAFAPGVPGLAAADVPAPGTPATFNRPPERAPEPVQPPRQGGTTQAPHRKGKGEE